MQTQVRAAIVSDFIIDDMHIFWQISTLSLALAVKIGR
jgi:hypothetical protein